VTSSKQPPPKQSATRKRQGRPSRYDDARGSIRSAALLLFAERGFEATSVADIATAAGMPKANVLYYYPNKDELWKDAVDTLWAEVDAFYAARLPAPLPPTHDGLALFLGVFLEACRNFPAYTSLPNLEGHSESWRARWLGERHLRRHVDSARGYFGALVKKGVVPDIDPVVFQNILAGGGQLLIGQEKLWQITLGDAEPPIDFAKIYVEGFLKLISANRQPI
jgi:TetR/AcrR family transcriptional regulator